MRRATIVALTIVLVLIAAALAYDPIREARMRSKLRALSDALPPGVTATSLRIGCFGPCTFGQFFSPVGGLVWASYPGGTNVTTLTHELRDTLTAHGWRVQDASDPQLWYDDSRTSGGAVWATGPDGIVSCFTGQDADLRVEVSISCRL